jgi:methionine-gamma-lyase
MDTMTLEKPRSVGFATIAIHGKKRFDKHETKKVTIRSVSTPIYQSSTFAFESAEQGARIFAGEEEGYIYTRLGNPTIKALEQEMAFLEVAEDSVAFASGMAATSAVVLNLCQAGDNLVAGDTTYGGTHKLFVGWLPKVGIEAREVDTRDPANVARAIDERTRLIFLETPAKPTLRLCDIKEIADIGHRHGIPVAVDNTFPTPYLQRPIEFGADIVVHSATKYIGGHGDTVAGLVVGPAETMAGVRGELADLGAAMSPFNAWLLLRGLKTLPVRMDKHTANAQEVAEFLSYHPKIDVVHYPGLRTHPQHELARRQMRGFGGMIAFEVKGGKAAGQRMVNAVEICTLAVSLGDVDTLIQHPATMTHSTYSDEDLIATGINPGLIRLSVGLEDVDDIVYDLRQALARM